MSEPNFEIYDNPTGILVGTVVLEVVAVTCVTLRFYQRCWQNVRCLASDWVILVALVFGTGLSVMEIYGVAVHAVAYPLGSTIEDPAAVNDRLNTAKHIELAYLNLGVVGQGLVKVSVSLLYWHLFAQVKLRRFLTCWIVVSILWTTAFVLCVMLECKNHLLKMFGTPQDFIDYCNTSIHSGWALVGTDVLTDLITVLIPIPVIWSLQLPKERKLLVSLNFLIGFLAVGASTAKAYIYITASLNLYTADAILILTGIGFWNMVEVQVGIIAACLMTLRPMLTHPKLTEGIMSLASSFRSSASLRRHNSKDSKGSELPSYVKTPSEYMNRT